MQRRWLDCMLCLSCWRTNTLLEKVAAAVEQSAFYSALWGSILTSPAVRLPGVSFVLLHLNRKLSMEDQLYVIGNDIELMVCDSTLQGINVSQMTAVAFKLSTLIWLKFQMSVTFSQIYFTWVWLKCMKLGDQDDRITKESKLHGSLQTDMTKGGWQSLWSLTRWRPSVPRSRTRVCWYRGALWIWSSSASPSTWARYNKK